MTIEKVWFEGVRLVLCQWAVLGGLGLFLYSFVPASSFMLLGSFGVTLAAGGAFSLERDRTAFVSLTFALLLMAASILLELARTHPLSATAVWGFVGLVGCFFLAVGVQQLKEQDGVNESILLRLLVLLPFGIGTVLGGLVLHWRWAMRQLPPPAPFWETDPLWAERLP